MTTPPVPAVLYCVDVQVETHRVEAWQRYMRQDHIPAVLATGNFSSCWFTSAGEREGGTLFVVIYVAHDAASLQRYRSEQAHAIQADHMARFGGFVKVSRRELAVLEWFDAGAPQG